MDRHLRENFEKGNVQLFVGAGLSYGLYPNPTEFCKILLEEELYIGSTLTKLKDYLGTDQLTPLEDAAQFYEMYKKPAGLVEMIRKYYCERKEPIEIHQNLWKLPNIGMIYTTNYDGLIEDAIRYPMQEPQVITSSFETRNIDPSNRVVFKLHGCARKSKDRSDFVITRNDYLNYSHCKTLDMLRTIYDISTKTFLFLGYSLKDLNMRHIITEANRIAESGVRSYAVLKDVSGPEVRYWENLNVTLIQMSAEDFFQEVFSRFPADETEFRQKAELRVIYKEEIANKALWKVIKRHEGKEPINVIIDAGSTCLYFAQALVREMKQGSLPVDSLRLITNSPPVVSVISSAMRNMKDEVPLVCVGGRLKYHTQAFVPEGQLTRELFGLCDGSNAKTIAFIGATSIDEEGLRTRREDEIAIKQLFIEFADEVYVLADHSKYALLKGGRKFSGFVPDKMKIITDRVHQMRELVKHVEVI